MPANTDYGAPTPRSLLRMRARPADLSPEHAIVGRRRRRLASHFIYHAFMPLSLMMARACAPPVSKEDERERRSGRARNITPICRKAAFLWRLMPSFWHHDLALCSAMSLPPFITDDFHGECRATA